MINNATQLKAKVRNLSKGDDKIAKAYIRIFFMERFMERLSISEYRDKFVLKGGMLISSLLGMNMRSTMDIDTTVKAIPLTEYSVAKTMEEVFAVDIEDNVSFKIIDIGTIMDDFDYPGVRVHFEAYLDRIRQPLKIDVSTDDVITPGAVEYDYKLLFEQRSIRLNTYNIETTLAEKAQTILNRGLANTRMRDYYDMYKLVANSEFSWETVKAAFAATCSKRETVFSRDQVEIILNHLSNSKDVKEMWDMFRKKNYFVGEIDYYDVIESLKESINMIVGLR